MASLFSDDEKAFFESLIDDVHDTFKREIYVYSEGTNLVMSLDPNYNGFYQRNVPNVQVTPIRTTIQARIKYAAEQPVDGINQETIDFQTKVFLPAGSVRLKVDASGYEVMKDARRIEFDGRTFIPESTNRPHGLFAPKYYTFILKPLENEP